MKLTEGALSCARQGAHLDPKYEKLAEHLRTLLPFVPYSLGSGVPAVEACVQPKSRTAQVGCTLRSLSHHLALLPPKGEVRTHWWSRSSKGEDELNLLLVPFPYRLEGSAFQPVEQPELTGKYFSLNQSWLESSRFRERFVEFIGDLIRYARDDGGRVHGVVLPELSLDLSTARSIGAHLLAMDLELFVCGRLAFQDEDQCRLYGDRWNYCGPVWQGRVDAGEAPQMASGPRSDRKLRLGSRARRGQELVGED